MPKLTDSQLAILSAAAQRGGGAVLPLPKSLKFKGTVVTRMLNGLRKQGLLEEQPAPHDAIAWREGEDGGRMMLVITAAGLKALDGEAPERSERAKSRAKKARAEPKAANAQGRNRKQPTSRAGTKQDLLIDLLKRKSGATIAEIVTATGWQAPLGARRDQREPEEEARPDGLFGEN